MEVNEYISYKLSQANTYLRKAKRILNEIELLNYKIECDFDSIVSVINSYYDERFKPREYENRFKDYY